MTDQDEVYVCEACGHPTTVADESCPNCGAPMTNIATGVKQRTDTNDSDELTDAEIAAGSEEGTLSLEALREDEEEEDQDDYARNNASAE